MIICVDTGGTFTDFIYKDGNEWGVYKLLSTPSNPAEAVLAGIRHIVKEGKFRVIHGSTVATNAILEKKGARSALITNKGFEDIIEIGRQNRSELYNLSYKKNEPLISSKLRFGISGRINYEGTVLEEIDEQALFELIDKLQRARVESIAVSLLFSFKNPEHELKVKKIFEKLDIPISLSHEILSEFREYERTSTTVINAYVSPKMKKYITYIKDNIGDNKLSIMQSNGGSISAETAMKESVRTILSGPAGGAVGAYELGKMAGFDRLITFDMGGTSTDVALIDQSLPLTLESSIAGFPVKVPMIDIHTVGAGGGSIAYIDAGGSLKVGPESAGADPGPICYGKGEHITVTDANLFLGRLIPDNFLGGKMELHVARLNNYFNKMSQEIGLSPIELAEGILSVANTAMERAIRVISVERGFDPGEFVLFSFGGAGGMHAPFLAKLLNMPKVLIPKNPGILSAIGMMMADIIKDYSQTVMLKEKMEFAEINKLFAPMEDRAIHDLLFEGINKNNIVLDKYLDMRYQGQSYEIIVPFNQNHEETFHKLHEKTYGYSSRDKLVEIVNIRLRARGLPDKPQFPKSKPTKKDIPSGAIIDKKPVIFDSKKEQAIILDRDKLICGNLIKGPAIVVEYSSTIVIPPFATGEIDGYGNIIISIN